MKRIILVTVMILASVSGICAQNAKILEQKEGSITFAVDENLQWRTTSHLLSDPQAQDTSLIEASYTGTSLILDDIPFFRGIVLAFAEHRSLTLSPDVIWTLICQNFAHDVTVDNPEMLKSDFTTTGLAELRASEIALTGKPLQRGLNIIQHINCGIPFITLTGTAQDWQKVLDGTQEMKRMGACKWASDLKPILEQFVSAAKGKPDRQFWQDIVMKARPENLAGGLDCGQSGILDGWFLKFMPYDMEGMPMPDLVSVSFKGYPRQMSSVYEEGNRILSGGIVGYLDDDEKYGIRFVVGWDIRKADALEAECFDRIRNENYYNTIYGPGYYLSSNADPLVVVDGKIRKNLVGADSFDWQNDSFDKEKVAGLVDVPARKIREILIFKDSDATYMWGRLGINGVLEVWTKKVRDKHKVRETGIVIASSPYTGPMHLR